MIAQQVRPWEIVFLSLIGLLWILGYRFFICSTPLQFKISIWPLLKTTVCDGLWNSCWTIRSMIGMPQMTSRKRKMALSDPSWGFEVFEFNRSLAFFLWSSGREIYIYFLVFQVAAQELFGFHHWVSCKCWKCKRTWRLSGMYLIMAYVSSFFTHQIWYSCKCDV